MCLPAGRKRASPDVAKDAKKADAKRRKSAKGAKQQQQQEEAEAEEDADAPEAEEEPDVAAAAADADVSEDGNDDAAGVLCRTAVYCLQSCPADISGLTEFSCF
jgi:hypothetical protein